MAQFRQFEESKGIIAEEGGFNEYPTCYAVVDEAPYECLILEDLGVDNFVMLDRLTDEITADHVKLVMRALGKFHALSFALKDQQPEKFKELSSQLVEIFYRVDNENIRKFLDPFGPGVIKLAESMGDDHITEKIRELFTGDMCQKLADLVDGSHAEPYAVIGHSDCWNNNTLFKFDENHNPVEMRLLDFQISRYVSPVYDLIHYIFNCTQKELRDQHYEDFLKVYHSSLSDHLERYINQSIIQCFLISFEFYAIFCWLCIDWARMSRNSSHIRHLWNNSRNLANLALICQRCSCRF